MKTNKKVQKNSVQKSEKENAVIYIIARKGTTGCITQRIRMKRASTQRERKAERMRHTERMRKTITAKPANMGNLPPQKTATPPTKAHTKRTAT